MQLLAVLCWTIMVRNKVLVLRPTHILLDDQSYHRRCNVYSCTQNRSGLWLRNVGQPEAASLQGKK